MADYVNSPPDGERNSPERRGRCHSGGSKVFMVVGVSFGLLCIVQAVLNISLRLQGTGSDHINSTNITNMSLADVSKLLRERAVLIMEIMMVNADNKWLRRHLSKQQDQISELEAENERLLMRLNEMGSQAGHCPQGWKFHMSSCYSLSTERKNWRDARDDCQSNGADLVVINDESEAIFEILGTSGSTAVWIGLKARSRGLWLWNDERRLTNGDLRKLQPHDQHSTCAYAEQSLPDGLKFVPADCADQHYWLCEMMVM